MIGYCRFQHPSTRVTMFVVFILILYPSICLNLLTILIVPSKAAFCISNCNIFQGIFFSSCLKLIDITPAAPITIGITRTSVAFHRRFTSIERSMYLSFFSILFFSIFASPGIAISMMSNLLVFLSCNMISGLLAMVARSVLI